MYYPGPDCYTRTVLSSLGYGHFILLTGNLWSPCQSSQTKDKRDRDCFALVMLPVFDQTYISSLCDTVQTQTQGSYAVKKNDRNNCITVHAWDTGHQVDWKEAKVKEAKPNLMKKQILEALHFQQCPYTTKLDCGLTINPVWFPLLTLSCLPPHSHPHPLS